MTDQGVVVVGSGAAGLAAALAAAAKAPPGARIDVLEAGARLGGTTALSGGVAWFPANAHGRAAGHDDTPDDAMRYLDAIGGGLIDRSLCRAFVDDAARVAAEIEERTRLTWELLDWPDYHPEAPGGTVAARSLWPTKLALPAAVAALVQASPEQLPGHEVPDESGGITDGMVFRGPIRGRILIGALVEALIDLGVVFRTDTRVVELDTVSHEAGIRVVGVVTEDGERLAGSVVLASGGFQHDVELARTHLPGEVAPMGVPTCRGDGLRMAAALDAELANLAGGWWMPSHHLPGEEIDGSPHHRPLHHERAQAGAIMVDDSGQRFVNEAANYGDVGEVMLATGRVPAWLVHDHADAAPIRADSVEQLAEAMGVSAEVLVATVDRFNADARAGSDRSHQRGVSYYDRWIAGGHTLAAIDQHPFGAVRVRPGCLGTRGGPLTDDRGRVLRPDGTIVSGLYAVGNVAASPFGGATAAGGATIGPALVFGTRAGEVVFDD